ncbi:MAG: heme-binding beta-barrel domain-containing protein [Psychromonas sp.]
MTEAEIKETNYGPLAGLIGRWHGNKGTDVSPEMDGSAEINKYYETIEFTEAFDTTNAEEEVISAVHYMLKVQRISTDKLIHQQTGYWMWNQSTNHVMHSLLIPRGSGLLAGGHIVDQNASNDTGIIFNVSANIDDKDWQIMQSPFLHANAKMTQFNQQLILDADTLSYNQTMILDIYGNIFDHKDENTLKRIKQAT